MNRQLVLALQQIEVPRNVQGKAKENIIPDAIHGAKVLVKKLLHEHDRSLKLLKMAQAASEHGSDGALALFKSNTARDLIRNQSLAPEHLERKVWTHLAELGVVRSTVIPTMMAHGDELFHDYLKLLTAMTLPPVPDLATYARQSEARQRLQRTMANDHFLQWVVANLGGLVASRGEQETDGQPVLSEDEEKTVGVALQFFSNMVKHGSRDTAEAVVGCMCRTQVFDLLVVLLEQNHDLYQALYPIAFPEQYEEQQQQEQEEGEHDQKREQNDKNDDDDEFLRRILGESENKKHATPAARRSASKATDLRLVMSPARRSGTGAAATAAARGGASTPQQSPQRRHVMTPSRAHSDAGSKDLTLNLPNNNVSPRRNTADTIKALQEGASPRKSTPLRTSSSTNSNNHNNNSYQVIISSSPGRSATSSSVHPGMVGAGAAAADGGSSGNKKSESPAAAAFGGAWTPNRGIVAPPLQFQPVAPQQRPPFETQLVIADGDAELMLEISEETDNQRQEHHGGNNNNNNINSTRTSLMSNTRRDDDGGVSGSRDRSASVPFFGSKTPSRATTATTTTGAAGGGGSAMRSSKASTAYLGVDDDDDVVSTRTEEQQRQHMAAVDEAMRTMMNEENNNNNNNNNNSNNQAQTAVSGDGDKDRDEDDNDDDDDDDDDDEDEDDGALRRNLLDGDNSSSDDEVANDPDVAKLVTKRNEGDAKRELEKIQIMNFTILEIFAAAFQLAPAAAMTTWNHPLLGGGHHRSEAIERELREKKDEAARIRLEASRNQGAIASSGLIVRRVKGNPATLAPGLITNKDKANQQQQADLFGNRMQQQQQEERVVNIAVGSVSAVLGSRHEDEAAINVDRRKKQKIIRSMLVAPLVSIVTMPLGTQKLLAAQFRNFSQHGFTILSGMLWPHLDRTITRIRDAMRDGREDKGLSIHEALDDYNKDAHESAGRIMDVVNFFVLATSLLRFSRMSIHMLVKVQEHRRIQLECAHAVKQHELQIERYYTEQQQQQQQQQRQQQQQQRNDGNDQNDDPPQVATPSRALNMSMAGSFDGGRVPCQSGGELERLDQQLAAIEEQFQNELQQLAEMANTESVTAMPIISDLVTLNRIRRGFDLLTELMESKELRDEGWNPMRIAEFLAEAMRLMVHGANGELIRDGAVVQSSLAMMAALIYEPRYVNTITQLVRGNCKRGYAPGAVVEPLLRLLFAYYSAVELVATNGVLRVPKKQNSNKGRKKKKDENNKSSGEEQIPQEQQQQQPSAVSGELQDADDENSAAQGGEQLQRAAEPQEVEQQSMLLCTEDGGDALPIAFAGDNHNDGGGNDLLAVPAVAAAPAKERKSDGNDDDDDDDDGEAFAKHLRRFERAERRQNGELDVSDDTESDSSDSGGDDDDEAVKQSKAAAAWDLEFGETAAGQQQKEEHRDVHLVDFLVGITQPSHLPLFIAALENWRTLADDVVDALSSFLLRFGAACEGAEGLAPMRDLVKVFFNMTALTHIIDIFLNARDIHPRLHQVARGMLIVFFGVGAEELRFRAARALMHFDLFVYNMMEDESEDTNVVQWRDTNRETFLAEDDSKAAMKARKQLKMTKRGLKAELATTSTAQEEDQQQQQQQRNKKRGRKRRNRAGDIAGGGSDDDADDDDDERDIFEDVDPDDEDEKRRRHRLKKEKKRAEKESKKLLKLEKKSTSNHNSSSSHNKSAGHRAPELDDDDAMAAFDVSHRAQNKIAAVASASAKDTQGRDGDDHETTPGGARSSSGARDAAAAVRGHNDGDEEEKEKKKKAKKQGKREKKQAKREQKKAKKAAQRSLRMDDAEEEGAGAGAEHSRDDDDHDNDNDDDDDDFSCDDLDTLLERHKPLSKSATGGASSGAKIDGEDAGGDFAVDDKASQDAKISSSVDRRLLIDEDQ